MDLLLIVAIVAGIFFVLRLVLRKETSAAASGTPNRHRKKHKQSAARQSMATAGAGAAVLTAAVAAAAYAQSGNSPSDDWLNDPDYWFMPGNISYRDQYEDDSFTTSTDSGSDWYTDPIYSWMPGNIYHHDTSCSSIGSDFSSTDYINDPIYSYMPCNIFHHDDSMDITCSNTEAKRRGFSNTAFNRCIKELWHKGFIGVVSIGGKTGSDKGGRSNSKYQLVGYWQTYGGEGAGRWTDRTKFETDPWLVRSEP